MTVMVTLLLIPAILVSGTAVDAARIYMTRNSVQNANQLAANAALASYNALLKDLYALYGFMADDPELAAMIDEYIKITVYGKDPDKGTFRSFIGSDDFTTDLYVSGNLRKTEVLKQQILEYMKFRGPAIILERIFGTLESGSADKIDMDSDILDIKKEIDDELEDVLDTYRNLYYHILRADSCRNLLNNVVMFVGYPNVGGAFIDITQTLESIRDDFTSLVEIEAAHAAAVPAETKNELRADYNETLADIQNKAYLISESIEEAWKNADKFPFYFNNVINTASHLDQKKESLKRKTDNLRRKLENGECSPEIYSAFMDPPPGDSGGKCLLERYEELLQAEVLPMAERYKTAGMEYLDDIAKPALEDPDIVRYRDIKTIPTSENSLTLEELMSITTNPDFSIGSPSDRVAYFAGQTTLPPEDPDYADFEDLSHYPPGPYYRFGNDHFPPEQVQFWKDLEAMVTGSGTAFVDLTGGNMSSGSDDSEKAQRNQINNLKNRGDDSDSDSTGGARKIDDPSWTKTNENVNWTSLPKNVIKVFSNPTAAFRNYADFALILTYDMSMFSNFTTTKPNKGPQDSITGVRMRPAVNYYYQAEWEYLLVGNKNASDNLSTIKKLIYAIRLIANFISIWSISEINIIVNMIRALPIPFGIPFVLGELARLAFLLCETSLDVVRLRNGYKVALFKNNNTWLCKPSTFGRLPGNFDDSGPGFTYQDYLTVFFIAKATLLSSPDNAANVLVSRTTDLIEWNVINYQGGVNADESKMAEALRAPDRFRMSNAATTFSLETTVDLRMLFLSMPLAQRGVNGVVPPTTLPIKMNDVRGY